MIKSHQLTGSAIDFVFVDQLIRSTTSHDQWLMLMSFGMSQLLEAQELLFECILRESLEDRACAAYPKIARSERVFSIIKKLGLVLSQSETGA